MRSVGEECLLDEELLKLLQKKPEPICYDGFEPSGRMHIAQVFISFSNFNYNFYIHCYMHLYSFTISFIA